MVLRLLNYRKIYFFGQVLWVMNEVVEIQLIMLGVIVDERERDRE